MTTTITRTQIAPAPQPVTLWRASIARARVEFLQFYREPSTVFFGFAFPIVMYAIFASIFTDTIDLGNGQTVEISTIYLAGMIAFAALTSGFQNVGVHIAEEKSDLTLRRLSLSPMPRAAYLLGKIIMVVVNLALQVTVLLLVAKTSFDAQLPTDWLRFSWVLLLGAASCTALGVAFGSFISSARASNAAATAITNVLAFISGCYIPNPSLPEWMNTLGQVFPLAWLAKGLRSTMLPDSCATAVETAGEWQIGLVAIILAAWTVAGLIVAVRFFRWSPKGSG